MRITAIQHARRHSAAVNQAPLLLFLIAPLGGARVFAFFAPAAGPVFRAAVLPGGAISDRSSGGRIPLPPPLFFIATLGGARVCRAAAGRLSRAAVPQGEAIKIRGEAVI